MLCTASEISQLRQECDLERKKKNTYKLKP